VAGLAHDGLQRHILLAEMSSRGVTQLVELPSLAGLRGLRRKGLEQDAGPVVAEPEPAGVRADITRCRPAGGDRAALGDEQRPAGTAGPVGKAKEPGQQVGGAGTPVNPLGVAALGADRGTPVVQVQVLHVQAEDLTRAGSGPDAGVRDAIAAGLAQGPRTQVSVVPLSQTGGHGDGFLAGPGAELSTDFMIPDYPGRPPHLADGPDEVRRVVRRILRAGADWIKIFATGGVMSASDGEFEPQFTGEELTLAVAEAARRGRGAMVHALGGPSIAAAVRAGARSIEHGVWLTEADAAMMAEHGTTLVPTLSIYRHLADEAGAGKLPPHVAARALAAGEQLGEAVRIAHAAGVPIALGSDFAHRDLHGHNLRELPLLRRAGLSAEEALLAATTNGARLCGVADQCGALTVGRRFDAIVIDRDPADLDLFLDPDTVTGVFLAGRPVRPHPRWPERRPRR
jgi:imidazolonepropionase-like amidohydrolase